MARLRSIKNSIPVFIALFLFPMISFSQNKTPVDSLLHDLDRDQPDTGRMKTYNLLGDYYTDNNAGKAIEFYENAKEIALKNDLSLRAANDFYSIGFCYLLKSDFERSLYNYQQSTLLYEKLHDNRRLSNAYMSIGNVYFQNRDIPKTNLYYDKAEAIIIPLKDTEKLASLYDTKGTINDMLEHYDTALFYLQKAFTLAQEAGLEDYAYNSLSNIGLAYKHQHKTAEALRYFDTVLVHFSKTDAPKDQLAALYNNIAATYAQAGDFSKALEAFAKSVDLAKTAGNPGIEMENYRNMSDMYGDMKNYALQSVFLKKYYNFKDSLFSADSKNKLTELESNYRLEKKNTELVKKDAEVDKQKSRQQVWIIVAFSVLALMVLLTLFNSRIQNKNKLLLQKNTQINEQKDELQTLNHVKDRLFSIISHDLRNPLVTLRSYLMLADNESVAPEKKQQFKVQTMNAVSQTGDMLDNLLAWANVQIKNDRANIIPINIADLLSDAVNNVKAQASQKQINIVQDPQAEMLPGDYDILNIALRNLLTNAIKYSPAKSNITVSATRGNGMILLAVKDEGIGLSKEQVNAVLAKQNNSTAGTQGEKGSGLGLFLVQELLQKINATLSIKTEEGRGSSFIILVPGF